MEIFVFGSNEAGRHGKGAALTAKRQFNAIYGQAEGLQGRSYAIPTKDSKLEALTLKKIKFYVDRFIAFANFALEHHPEYVFNITRIGCGLAGYRDEDIAPMFANVPEKNCRLPSKWKEYLVNPKSDE